MHSRMQETWDPTKKSPNVTVTGVLYMRQRTGWKKNWKRY